MHYLLGLWHNSRSRNAIDGAIQMSGELSERRNAVDNDRAARPIGQMVSKLAHSGDIE